MHFFHGQNIHEELHLFFPGSLAAFDALLYPEPPHLFHEQEYLVSSCADVHTDLLQLQLCKVLQHLPLLSSCMPYHTENERVLVALMFMLMSS